jgi:hypothetical protein
MNDITLPLETAKLSVEEIGTIFLVMAMPHLSDDEKVRWATDDMFIKTLRGLIKEEIVIISNDEVEINLTWL